MHETFANGSLVTYRVRNTFQPLTPARILDVAQAHGMPESVCPEYAGDKAIASRAIQSQLARAKAAGWLVSLLESTKGKTIYTIARIDKDVEGERTDYAHETTIKWSSEAPEHLDGWHDVAQEMNRTYLDLRGRVQASDWTAHIIDYVKGPCRGVAFLDAGKMYWVPPQGTRELERLRGFLDAVGIGLVIGDIAPESQGDVREVAAGGLHEQLDALRAKIEGFDGDQAPGVYRRSLDELRQLRQTQTVYENALGVTYHEVRAMGAELDRQVREMLTVRLDTVIHKDGTRDKIERPSVSAQAERFGALMAGGEAAIAQALLSGDLVLDGDAQDVEALFHDVDAAASDPAMDTDLAGLLAVSHAESDLPESF